MITELKYPLNKSKVIVLLSSVFSHAFHNCRENETQSLVTQSLHIYPGVWNEWKAPLLFDTLSISASVNSTTFSPPASVCLV